MVESMRRDLYVEVFGYVCVDIISGFSGKFVGRFTKIKNRAVIFLIP